MNLLAPRARRQRDVVAAEVTKILTHPTVMGSLVVVLLINTTLGLLDAADVMRLAVGSETARLSELQSLMFAPIYAFLILPVYAAASEYRAGQIRISLTAVPDRVVLLSSKLVATIAVSLPAAVAVVAPGRVLMAASQASFSAVLADLGRWTTVYVLMSVIAFGFAGILRSSVAALTVLIMVPLLVATGVFQWPDGIRMLPDQASLSLLGTPGYDVTELAPGTAAVVLIVWGAGFVVAYGVMFVRRDS